MSEALPTTIVVDGGDADSEAESADAGDRQQDQPVDPEQAHAALIAQLVATSRDDRAFLERIHGLTDRSGTISTEKPEEGEA